MVSSTTSSASSSTAVPPQRRPPQSPSILQGLPNSKMPQGPPRTKRELQTRTMTATSGSSAASTTAGGNGGGVVLLPSPHDGNAHYQTMDKLYGPSSDAVEVSNNGSSTINQCAISWQNLSFSVRHKHKRDGLCRSEATATLQDADGGAVILDDSDQHTILKSISGRSAPGDLTAIIGPSGAGKTTLLDMLANRLDGSSGLVRGVVEVNGRARDPKTFRSVMNYVSQDMAFLGSFTVLETLQ
ncbi:hypothetical protein Gpo141_00013112, partial [Globisporangium polare]